MIESTHNKVQSRHLQRKAYLYVRQSTLRQVFENTESTKRQYALRERAVALGWCIEDVIIIDSDLGQSGASAVDREGFQHLVTEVGLGRAGIVMGLEVSRLARNSTDWHRLLEICALADTLILDEDGIYDPAHFNDRLLLGLKGAMSEAELHVLRARLRGGILNKARRGELEIPLPIGYVRDIDGRVRLDPDNRVQDSVKQLFHTFQRTGSATATVKAFHAEGLTFPRYSRRGPRRGEVLWTELTHSRVLWILHHPGYTGAFCFGRTRQRKHPNGRVVFRRLPTEEWIALIRDIHPAYITWEEFEQHKEMLHANAQAHGNEREQGAPREGPALLQGLAVCAKCGDRMTVRYHLRAGRKIPDYMCQHAGIEHAQAICQTVQGGGLDVAVGELLVELVTPVTLEVALRVQQELENRAAQSDHLRHQAVDQARYQVDLARRRYMRVDPDNRLVAESLEAEWNHALRELNAAQECYEKQQESADARLKEPQRAKIMALANDFPRLWNDPLTPDRERKRMTRLLIADVTLLKDQGIRAQIRFHGGATHTLYLPSPRPIWMTWQTPTSVIAAIDRLLEEHTDIDTARILNEQGLRSGQGKSFDTGIIRHIRDEHRLKSLYERLRARGLLTSSEIAQQLNVTTHTVKTWRRAGLLQGVRYNDKDQYLYEPPGVDAPTKHQHHPLKKAVRLKA